MSSTYHTTEGIVIKKTPYGEADFLVRFLTEEFGKIDLHAKGARKVKSKLNPHLDFLDIVNVSFVKNGDGIPTVIDSQKVLSNNHWTNTENNLHEAVLVSRAIDLLIPFDVRDTKVFSLFKNFFEKNTNPESFLRSIIVYEGYGNANSLPQETRDFIIKEWPTLRS